VDSRKRSWLALITFCTATALVAALGLAVLFASATVAFAVAQTVNASHRVDSGQQTNGGFSGLVTDSTCGARHETESASSPAECVQACVRKGASYVLVDGDKIYQLAGNPADFQKVAGQRVKVEGSLHESTIQVSSIESEPASK